MGFGGAPHSMHTSLLSNAFDMNSDLSEVVGGRLWASAAGGPQAAPARPSQPVRTCIVRVRARGRFIADGIGEDHAGAGVGV